MATEKSLVKNKLWGEMYDAQIRNMVKRGAALIISDKEISSNEGHVNFLLHLAVMNPHSDSNPVRMCVDALHPRGNSCERSWWIFIQIGLSYRKGAMAVKGDVAKMYNSVQLETEDAYLQCFCGETWTVHQRIQFIKLWSTILGCNLLDVLLLLPCTRVRTCLLISILSHANNFKITATWMIPG